MIMCKKILFLFAFLINIFLTTGQENILLEASNSIKIDELKEKLYKYSSDEFEGRGTPSQGQQLAVEYIVNHYKKLGIPPIKKDNYLQAVPLQLEDKPDIKLNISGQKFIYYQDYVSYLNGPDREYKSKEIVFVGYGIDDPNYSDYKNIDVKGKVVVALGGEPLDNNNQYFINGKNKSKWSILRQEIDNKRKIARNNGALALIIIDDYLHSRYSDRYRNSDIGYSEKRMTLSNNEENNFQVLLFPNKFKNFLSKDNLTFNMSFRKNIQKVTADNVAAIIKGSEFPDEYVILTAHLDHVLPQGGEIYNGADDNGSGTIAMLEIAEAFSIAKQMGKGPKRSIIFLHVTAEERGLLGSKYYTDYEPLVPIKQSIANLNMDMMGRADPKRGIRNLNYVYIIGSDILSDDLHNINIDANKYANLELDFRFNGINHPDQFYYRSDHFHFIKNNIPAIFYFSGVHEDYHEPTDTADKILYEPYRKRVKLIFHTAWELANTKERIKLK